MAYSNFMINVGVAELLGAYLTTWGSVNLPQYPMLVNPIPSNITNNAIWLIYAGTDHEMKLTTDTINLMMNEVYVQEAFDELESLVGVSTITELKLSGIDNYVVCIGGVTVFNPVLINAKWMACGIWQIINS